ncbi:MAG: metallophosphoesterase [Actinobacteria bacterium]|nr:metallophosphoesterase [Actinomycetota bacterium]
MLERLRALRLEGHRSVILIRLGLLLLVLFAASRAVAPSTFPVKSGDLVVDLVPSIPGGKLELELGPFGRLSWNTHHAPMNIEATFRLGRTVRNFPTSEDLDALRSKLLLAKLPWVLLAGAAAAALLTQNPSRVRFKVAAAGAGISSLLVAITVLATALTFNADALKHPSYRGPIQDAPRVISLLREAQGNLAGVKRNITKVIAGLSRIHTQITTPASATPLATTRVLVISDIHNNPVGLLIAKEMADQFGVDAVIDAGDFTDRGSAPEAELFARFASLGVPHIVIGGNHEDRAVLGRIKRIPGVRLLESRTMDTAHIKDIVVLGDTDPNAYSIDSNPYNEVAQRGLPAKCDRLNERFLELRPAIVMVHDPRMGDCVADDAEANQLPLVYVWGHLHRQSYAERGSVVSLSPGTSGANGIKTGKAAPYGFVMLDFDAETDALSSVCLFSFDGPSLLREATCHLTPSGRQPPLSAVRRSNSP